MSTRRSGSQKKKNPITPPTAPADDPERIKKDDDTRYQVYLDENRSLVSGEETSADHLDKNILTLAAGAIAISLVFLEKIAPNPQPSTLVFLCLAWVSLIGSLLSTLISFLT